MILHLARLGIEPSSLADSDCAAHGYPRQGIYAVSTEHWRGRPDLNRHLAGEACILRGIAHLSTSSCSPVFPGCPVFVLRKHPQSAISTVCYEVDETTKTALPLARHGGIEPTLPVGEKTEKEHRPAPYINAACAPTLAASVL